MDFQPFLDALHKIPDVVWSGLIASALTLIGTLGAVIATNRGSNKRLSMQLAHDRSEKFAERTASIRKEVYLNAAADLNKANNTLSQIPSIEASKISSKFSGLFRSLARIQIVGNQETVTHSSAIAQAYGHLIWNLSFEPCP